MSPLTESVNFKLANATQPLDADAQAYVNAVEIADGQRIEDAVRFAINNFVIGCKQDGIWPAIKASCILCGARTLSGALQPLVLTSPSTAPARFGTAGGWNYSRKTGLQGNGTDNYIDTGRNNNADLQNSNHMSVFASSLATSPGTAMLGSNAGSSGSNSISAAATRNRSTTPASYTASSGFIGTSRNNSLDYTRRNAGTNETVTQGSSAADNANLTVFAFVPQNSYSNARLAFYSIGESLDLAKLDSRVTDLINAFGAAIP